MWGAPAWCRSEGPWPCPPAGLPSQRPSERPGMLQAQTRAHPCCSTRPESPLTLQRQLLMTPQPPPPLRAEQGSPSLSDRVQEPLRSLGGWVLLLWVSEPLGDLQAAGPLSCWFSGSRGPCATPGHWILVLWVSGHCGSPGCGVAGLLGLWAAGSLDLWPLGPWAARSLGFGAPVGLQATALLGCGFSGSLGACGSPGCGVTRSLGPWGSPGHWARLHRPLLC